MSETQGVIGMVGQEIATLCRERLSLGTTWRMNLLGGEKRLTFLRERQ